MGVAVEGALWVSVGALIAGQVPDDQSLISASRQEHVGAIQETSASILSKKLRCQICAYFSIEVAKLVTQPLWPSRVPFRISCSVMLGGIDVSFELKVVKA